jgi:hypothetical protein
MVKVFIQEKVGSKLVWAIRKVISVGAIRKVISVGAIRKVINVGGRVQRAVKGNDPHVKLFCCLMWLYDFLKLAFEIKNEFCSFPLILMLIYT